MRAANAPPICTVCAPLLALVEAGAATAPDAVDTVTREEEEATTAFDVALTQVTFEGTNVEDRITSAHCIGG
jgi:hypothetical protein